MTLKDFIPESLREKFENYKVIRQMSLNLNGIEELDDAIPRWLRESINAVDSEEIQMDDSGVDLAGGDGHVQYHRLDYPVGFFIVSAPDNNQTDTNENSDEVQSNVAEISSIPGEISSSEFVQQSTENLTSENDTAEMFENARSCPEDCDHEDCPFQLKVVKSEIFSQVRPQFSISSFSLIRKVSSMSTIESIGNQKYPFIKITGVMPLRNQALIIRWSVRSYYGIKGYKIHIDGEHVSTVFSSERSSAYVPNVTLALPHHIAISAVSEDTGKYSENLSIILEPAVFIYQPSM